MKMDLSGSTMTAYLECLIVVFLCMFCTGRVWAQMGSTEDICMSETFNATCGTGHVMMMRHALYGRMNTGRCASMQYGSIGCKQDALGYMDAKCSGRHSCQVVVADLVGLGMTPCPVEVSSYLEVGYECVAVSSAQRHQCVHATAVKVQQPSGYLSSLLTEVTDVGTRTCPWRVAVDEGQKVNITLIDFGIWSRRTLSDSQQSIYCDKYAILHESTISQDTPICASDQRIRNVYVSKTSTLDVSLIPVARGREKRHFLLKYEVIGCQTYVPPENTQVTISDNVAIVTCDVTGVTWQMNCVGAVWQGDVKDCNEIEGPAPFSSLFGENWTSAQGILMVITLGIVLGVLIGLVLLLVSLLCLRRRGWQLPCGLTSKDHNIQNRSLPNRPEYNYKYTTAVDKQVTHDSLLHSDRTFMDPQTGAIYEGYPGGRTMVFTGAEEELGPYKVDPGNVRCTHVYECPDFEGGSVPLHHPSGCVETVKGNR